MVKLALVVALGLTADPEPTIVLGSLTDRADQENFRSDWAGLFSLMKKPLVLRLATIYLTSTFRTESSKAFWASILACNSRLDSSARSWSVKLSSKVMVILTSGVWAYSLSNLISTSLLSFVTRAKPAVSWLKLGLPSKLTSPLKTTCDKNLAQSVTTKFLEVRDSKIWTTPSKIERLLIWILSATSCPETVAMPATFKLGRFSEPEAGIS